MSRRAICVRVTDEQLKVIRMALKKARRTEDGLSLAEWVRRKASEMPPDAPQIAQDASEGHQCPLPPPVAQNANSEGAESLRRTLLNKSS